MLIGAGQQDSRRYLFSNSADYLDARAGIPDLGPNAVELFTIDHRLPTSTS